MSQTVGFTINSILCSGCSFDGKTSDNDDREILHPDLNLFYSLKEDAIPDVVNLHNRRRGISCSGGRLRISYSDFNRYGANRTMIRKITITQNHMDAATFGAGMNIIARAINDHIRSDYRSTVTGFDIKIWDKDFNGNSFCSIPIPAELINRGRNIYPNADRNIRVPYEFEIDIPEQYHRRPGRNVQEDMEFIMRHGE